MKPDDTSVAPTEASPREAQPGTQLDTQPKTQLDTQPETRPETQPETGAVSAPYPVQLRFSDTDRLGHVNNAVYATFAELGRLAFLRELGMTDKGLILAHLSIDFLRQVRLEDECVVFTRVVRVGNTSFELAQTLDANGEPAARFKAVVVCFDYATQRPMRVPDDFRRALLGAD